MPPTRPIDYIRVYGSVRNEKRIHRVAVQLKMPPPDVLGRLVWLWIFAQENLTELVDMLDAEINTFHTPGFIAALAQHELIDIVDERTIKVRGVRDEIDAERNRQEALSANGMKSVHVRRMKSSIQNGTMVQTGLNLGSSHGSIHGLNRVITPPETNSDVDLPESSESRSDQIKHLRVQTNYVGIAASGAILETDLQNVTGDHPKVELSASQDGFQPRQDAPEGLPAYAMRLGTLIVDWVTKRVPLSKVAKGNARYKRVQCTINARNLNKLHVTHGIDWTDIEQALDWVQNDPFWSTTITSGRGLVDHWDRIQAKRHSSTTNGSSNGHHPTTNRGRVEPMPPEAFGDGDVEL